ncbi:fimbrial-like protein [Enterobacter mori]
MFFQTGILFRMSQSHFYLKNAVSALPACLMICGMFPAVGLASNMEMDMTANIINNTCQVTIPDNGKVILPIVGKNWFYNSDGSPRLQPGDADGGTRFAVKLKSCAVTPSGIVKTLHFEFKPQNGQFAGSSKQVFANDTAASAGGAENVGVVIFSEKYNTNVVNAMGDSNVVFDISGQNDTEYLTTYNFYARYQSTGSVSAGKVTTSALVSVIYN